MEEKKVSTMFEEMRDNIAKYITSTIELGKLEAYEKISLGSSAIIVGFILGGVSLIALLLILITTGLYLGNMLQSYWQGFGIVTAIALLVAILILILKKPIKKKITNNIVRFLLENNDEDKK